MTTAQSTPLPGAADEPTRARALGDIRALADFLEANPDLPISPYGGLDVVFFPPGDDEAQAGQVARVSELLGTLPRREGEHYTVERRIGRAAYRVVAIPAEARARYRALMSYADAVRPE
ncbi:hypothetical protein [Nocardiopsis composta]|uniref:Uncharacterized protein n=1 Tax=Nocardiopsis composta TaxID=157465 RepID=A0A7W8VG92_9ACTN|nr:hypothetical protein [Nocardiopsis composta]MBB5435222.1 hypothetical protein [Nocardiopsis composta]